MSYTNETTGNTSEMPMNIEEMENEIVAYFTTLHKNDVSNITNLIEFVKAKQTPIEFMLLFKKLITLKFRITLLNEVYSDASTYNKRKIRGKKKISFKAIKQI